VEYLAYLDALRDEFLAGASMSYTAKTRRSIEPGRAEVIPLPKMIEASEQGGVLSGSRHWGGVVDIQAEPQFLVEALGPIVRLFSPATVKNRRLPERVRRGTR
jgi:hypothetical protein